MWEGARLPSLGAPAKPREDAAGRRGGEGWEEWTGVAAKACPLPGGTLVTSPRGSSGSGRGPQGAHVHAGQAEPGGGQPLAGAVLVEADAEEEVARAEEQKGPEAG